MLNLTICFRADKAKSLAFGDICILTCISRVHRCAGNLMKQKDCIFISLISFIKSIYGKILCSLPKSVFR